MSSENIIIWHNATVTRELRNLQRGHRSAVLWFTGLSGAGKSAITHSVEEQLFKLGCSTFVLDGDNVRHGLCSDLGFSDDDRKENIRRIGETGKLMFESGLIAITAYEPPLKPELILDTEKFSIDESVKKVMRLLVEKGILNDAK